MLKADAPSPATRPVCAMTAGERDGAISVWTAVLDLIEAGTPIDGLRIIAKSNKEALEAGKS